MAAHWVKWQSKSWGICWCDNYAGCIGRNDYHFVRTRTGGGKALADSPWGLFTIAATIPIALFMGVYMRFIRPGKIAEVSLIGFVLMMSAIIYGGNIAVHPYWGLSLRYMAPR